MLDMSEGLKLDIVKVIGWAGEEIRGRELR